MAHPFYPSGNPRFNHVAMSMPADLLSQESRSDICRFFSEVLGFEEMEVMTEDRHRLILRPEAEVAGQTADTVLADIASQVTPPR